MIQMDDVAVEVVGPERAGLARGIAGPGRGRRSAAGIEHGVVDDQLAPSLAQLVPQPRELLLAGEERRPRHQPLFVRHYRVMGETARAVLRHGSTASLFDGCTILADSIIFYRSVE